jgi:hypothetical protein
MWPHTCVLYLLTLSEYVIMDSVLIDLDNPSEATAVSNSGEVNLVLGFRLTCEVTITKM